MIPKYTVEYHMQLRKHSHISHYGTDDPLACEEFLVELLERGARIAAIKHEGVDLEKNAFDRLIRTAACMLAAKHICTSLGIDAEEEKYRFGLAA
jgi:hypothetical protein